MRLIVPILLIAATLSLEVGLRANRSIAGESEPFVIGFERFGRYDDIDGIASAALLLTELNCTACHATDHSLLKPKLGPNLSGAGNRLRREWLRDFIGDPDVVQPGTTMPNLMKGLDAVQRDKISEAIAAYLTSLSLPFTEPKAGGALPVLHEYWRRGDIHRGQRLFHQVGCVACHKPDPDFEPSESAPSPVDALIEQLDPEEIADMGLESAARAVPSIRHGDLVAKYSRRSLTAMLMDPQKTHPSARMPSLRLQPSEAADLTAFLLRNGDALDAIESDEHSTEQVPAGRRHFRSLRCVNCHGAGFEDSPRLAKPMAELNWQSSSSCIRQPKGPMPTFGLSAKQQETLIEFGRAAANWKAAPAQFVRHRLLQLNCYACHDRGLSGDAQGLGGVGRFRKRFFETTGQIDIGDEGRLPPSLSSVGRKLTSTALASVFAVKTPTHRPFMRVRMPAYHAEIVRDLVAELPKADQVKADQEREADGRRLFDTESVDVGRELTNSGCVECHAFAGESLPGAVGVDIASIEKRIRPAWFREFLLDPGALKARTRMPTFFPNGKSHRADLLDGDAERQIAALWHYLKDPSPLPNKLRDAMSEDFELTPKGRPIILRTFMKQAGNHAIAVGFPNQVSYAFDAKDARLAIAWKGRFLDARSTWFERFAPPVDPLDDTVVLFPPGDLLVKLPSSDSTAEISAAFLGYRIDQKGIPTFLYEVGDWRVEDRIDVGKSGLLRSISLRGRGGPEAANGWAVRVHAGAELNDDGEKAMVDASGLRVRMATDANTDGTVTDQRELQSWLVPTEALQSSPGTSEKVIELEYRW